MNDLNKTLEKATDTLEDVIEGITRKENITPADLEHLSKTICTIERIKNIQHTDSEEYSENSYRRGRSRTTGRYMSRDFDDKSGHSIKDRMIARLEEMFDETQSEHEKQIVQDWLNRLSSR